MAKGIVIADDLTGANATGVLLKKNGFSTYTILNTTDIAQFADDGCDCVVLPTDSRALPPQQAYDRVAAALKAVSALPAAFYSKRIDSTLRGNLGSETDAFLDALGQDYIAVCVPCFPASSRCLVGGYLLVNNVLLHKTEVAADPKCPIHTSSAKTLFASQTKYPIGTLHLDEIDSGVESLAKLICTHKEQGNRILICDAVNDQDIETIAAAVIASKTKFVAVDPGVFTATIAKQLLKKPRTVATDKVLCVIGSVNGVAREQVKQLLGRLPVHCVMLETQEILESETRRQAEIARVVQTIQSGCSDYDILAVVGCGIEPARRVAFEPYLERYRCTVEELSQQINTAFAEVTHSLLTANSDIRAVYSTGGDITAAINHRLGSCGLRLLDEVVPLAGYGEIIGGKFSGIQFISKGGMVGDSMAMVTCVRYLKDHIEKQK